MPYRLQSPTCSFFVCSMKKPAAKTYKKPVMKKPAGSGGTVSLSTTAAETFTSPVKKKPPGSGGDLSRSRTAEPQTPASDATTRHLGSPEDVTSEAELLAPAGMLLDWDGFSPEQKLRILKERAKVNPPAWLPSPMEGLP